MSPSITYFIRRPPSHLTLAGLLLITIISLLSLITYASPSTSLTGFFRSGGPDGQRPVTYLPYTFGYEMLLQTLEGYKRAGWRDIVIVDNSWDHHAYTDFKTLKSSYPVIEIIPTPVHLRFTQIQSFIDLLASQRQLKAYLWSHTDVLVLSNLTSSSSTTLSTQPKTDLTAYQAAMQLLDTADQDIGIIFFAYDWLSGVFTSPSSKAPWDPSMPQYGSDCDRYRRIRIAGYRTIDSLKPIGEILHLHSPLSSDQLEEVYNSGWNSTEQRRFVEKVQEESKQYAWREGGGYDTLTEIDKASAEAEGKAGTGYFESKWGWPFDCEIEDRYPKFDVPAGA